MVAERVEKEAGDDERDGPDDGDRRSGAPGEWYEELNRARRGPLPRPRRAQRKLSRASRMAASPGPVELSTQPKSSAACSRTVPWRPTCEAAPSIRVTRWAMSPGLSPNTVRTSVARS